MVFASGGPSVPSSNDVLFRVCLLYHKNELYPLYPKMSNIVTGLTGSDEVWGNYLKIALLGPVCLLCSLHSYGFLLSCFEKLL